MNSLTPDSDFDAALVDMLDLGVVAVDAERIIRVWNAWMERASGKAAEDVIGCDLLAVYPHLPDSRLPGAIEDAVGAGIPSVLTHSLNRDLLRLRRADGAALLHKVVVRRAGTAQRPLALVQVHDVTDEAHREAALRKRRDARYGAVVDSAPDSIVTTDGGGNILWFNGSTVAQFGFPADDLTGRNVSFLIPGGAEWHAAMGDDALHRFETRGRRHQGPMLDLEVSVRRWTAEGRWFATGILRDISERKRAERALAASEAAMRQLAEQTRATLDTLPARIALVGGDGTIELVNHAWGAATPGSQEAFIGAECTIGNSILEAIDKEGRFAAGLKRVLRGQEGDFEFEYCTGEDGNERWYRCLAVPTVEGLHGGAVVMHIDITAARHAQDELNSALKARDVLLREVNHRIKNSLQLVVSLLGFQSSTIDDPAVVALFDDARNRIQAIAHVHERLYKSGDFQTVAMNDYLAELCREIASASGGTDVVDLQTEFQEGALPLDTAVPLGLVANELVTNAIKHNGGRRARVRVDYRQEAGHYSLTVSDNGPGLPPGFDLHRSTSTGMVLVAGLAQQLGAAIDLPAVAGGTAIRLSAAVPETVQPGLGI